MQKKIIGAGRWECRARERGYLKCFAWSVSWEVFPIINKRLQMTSIIFYTFVHSLNDHLLNHQKVALKTNFGQSQMWSFYIRILLYITEHANCIQLQDVLGISKVLLETQGMEPVVGLVEECILPCTVKFLYQDHLWNCPKVVLKTTFGQFQRWSLTRGTRGCGK